MLPTISIIIPFVEVTPLFQLAIKSCSELNYPKERMELILVYNREDKLEFITNLDNKDISLKLIQENKKNPYIARNKGAKIAKGAILIFTDSDCIVDKNWAMNLVSPFKDNKICAVLGKVLAYNPVTAFELFGSQYIFNYSQMPFKFPLGCNSAIRKRLFNEIGGFDEDFISGGDMDLGIRLIKNNFYIHYEPKAVVYHKHRNTLRGLFKQYKKYGGGWWALKKKWSRKVKMYKNWKRILVFFSFMFITVFDLLLYIFSPKTINNKARRLRYLYLAMMNLALVIGFYHRRIRCK